MQFQNNCTTNNCTVPKMKQVKRQHETTVTIGRCGKPIATMIITLLPANDIHVSSSNRNQPIMSMLAPVTWLPANHILSQCLAISLLEKELRWVVNCLTLNHPTEGDTEHVNNTSEMMTTASVNQSNDMPVGLAKAAKRKRLANKQQWGH